MRNFLGIAVFSCVFLIGGVCHVAAGDTLMLKENWALQSSAKLDAAAKGETLSRVGSATEGWYPTRVPMTVLAALVENGVYPDPYYGLNLKSIPGYKDGAWLIMPKDSPFRPAWWYRTEFDVPADFAGKNLVLHLDGINYRANVWLNGKRVAGSDTVVGMFRRFEFDVNDYIQAGSRNCLAVEIFAPGDLPEKSYNTKQVEATTGWDDHNPQPPDLNMGIWQDVYITATGPAALRHPYVNSELELPSLAAAKLTVSVYVINKTDKAVAGVLSGTIEKITFSKKVELAPNETKEVVVTPDDCPGLAIKKPRVWWPVDVGPQEMYKLDLTFKVGSAVSDTASTPFAIRDATTYINEEGWRGYKINGRNILIRGGAWMTSDMLLRLSPKRYDALVRYAKEGHLNMLRSEGFSIRETEEFYNRCDKYGVMVTQQIFGRSIPDEVLAIACIDDMMLRIRNHPSLVHFLGHDETFPTPTLDQAYRDLIEKYRVKRTYQPHSGAFELKERFETGGTRTGSLQVWTYATPKHYYIAEDTGAWGFAQSGGIGGVFASLESMRRMMPEQDLWPPFSEAWSFHTVRQGASYFSPVRKAINDRYGPSTGIVDFLQKGLALNYESARGMFEAYGRNKYKATGITAWKYDAAWPASPTWQYVDWYLIATGGYYGAKKACEPLHIQYSYDDNSIYVVNSYYEDHPKLKATAQVFNLDLSEKLNKTAEVSVAANDKTKVFDLEWPEGLTKSYFLRLRLEAPDGTLVSENFYWLSTVPDLPSKYEAFFANPASTADYKDLNTLSPVKLNVSSEIGDENGEKAARVTIENPSRGLAFFVHAAVMKGEGGQEVAPTFWSDNYISIFPGEKKTVIGRFAAEDLDGTTPAIKMDGWNVAP